MKFANFLILRESIFEKASLRKSLSKMLSRLSGQGVAVFVMAIEYSATTFATFLLRSGSKDQAYIAHHAL